MISNEELPTNAVPEKTAPQPTFEPSKRHWAAAIGGAFVAVALLYACELAADGYYYARMQTGFAEFVRGDVDLNFAVDNPAFKKLFVNHTSEIRSLRPLISLVMLEDSSKASAYLKTQALTDSPHRAELVSDLTELSAQSVEEEQNKLELQKLAQADEASGKDYANLKNEFVAFLKGDSSPRLATSDESDDEEFSYYEFGMLTGLPVVEGLPENISDFKQLVEFYPLTKPDAIPPTAEELTHKLNEIKVKTANFKFEQQNNDAKEQTLAKRQEEIAARKKELFQNSKNLIADALVSLARPHLDQQTVAVYAKMRSVALHWGWQLPELHS